VEAADAYGLTGWTRFKRVVWPTMLRLAWPAYTNEAIFLFHATTLVYISSFPAWQQRGDALYYASYFADKTFNPFVPYPILAGYFIVLTLIVITVFGLINTRLNRHLPEAGRQRLDSAPECFAERLECLDKFAKALNWLAARNSEFPSQNAECLYFGLFCL